MKLNFEKYQGTGNDFVLIDDRERIFPQENTGLISQICSRKFGVGSDGLMLIRTDEEADFEMIFFNPDGSKSLCGNGSRCAVAFAVKHNIAPKEGTLHTTDGLHKYRLEDAGDVHLEMRPVDDIEKHMGFWFINTGSPHLIVPVRDVNDVDVVKEGRHLRNEPVFIPINGANINFVSAGDADNRFKVRTYERGVEDETLSCGTGVAAVALALALDERISEKAIIETRGGTLQVHFRKQGKAFDRITLTGAAQHVYTGEIDA